MKPLFGEWQIKETVDSLNDGIYTIRRAIVTYGTLMLL